MHCIVFRAHTLFERIFPRFPLLTAVVVAGLLGAAATASMAADGGASQVIRLVLENEELGPPAKYGVDQLTDALEKQNVKLEAKEVAEAARVLRVGTYLGSDAVRKLADEGEIQLAKQTEALSITRQTGERGSTLLVAGYDDVGLMYALLELADEVEHCADISKWFENVEETFESPRNAMRRMRVLMHHAANEADWYHSKEYWDWYIGMLASNRFNGLNLVYSHQTPYMAPMYAWHLKIDEFPDVRPIGISDEQRQENLEVLRHIAKLCHDRGIELTIGVWQHLPWMHSYLQSRPDQKSLVEGLDGKNIGPYTYLAVKKLLQECPGIARIQIRPNDESGIHSSQQTAFYRDNVMRAIKETAPHVKLDLRTVGVQASTIEAARKADLGVRTSIKFYGEFLGLPHTPREILTRNYSYGQFLKKPMPNPVYNEVWMLGSHRVLLWGSEDYARQFGRQASYGGTIGFETDGPLAQKGYQQPTGPAWRIFKNRDDEYFEHEIERYWAFFRASGRFSYNPDTSHLVWMRPFRKRFGDAAEEMAAAYESASRVIGLIVASHVEDINMYVWPEISMGGLLSAYTDLRGADKGLFPSIDEQVDAELAGHLTGRLGPTRLAALYDEIAKQVDRALASADGKLTTRSKEYRATVNDFQILAGLARYHAHRQREGYLMSKFYRTSDASLLPAAMEESTGALEVWKKLVEIAEGQYHAPMQTGPRENGHWKDKTFLVEANTKIIREAEKTLRQHGVFDWGFDFGRPALTGHYKVFGFYHYANDYFHERRFIGMDASRLFDPRIGYGFVNNEDLQWTRNPMVYLENLSGTRPMPNSPLPLDLVAADFVSSKQPIQFRMNLPMDGYRFTFIFSDRSAEPKDHGPFDLQSIGDHGPRTIQKGIRVPAGESVIRQVDQHIRRNGWNPFWTFALKPATVDADAILSGLTVHRDAPNMAHAYSPRISPESCQLSVTITMPPQRIGELKNLSAAPGDRLVQSTLHFRTSENAAFQTTKLNTDDGFVYRASVEPKMLDGRWLEYFFTATDRAGRTTRLPEAATGRTYRARLTADTTPPTIEHEPIQEWTAGKPMPIKAKVTDADGVAIVRAYYRRLDETLPYECVVLERQGNTFTGTIPGEAIESAFDFVYYLEAVDEGATGCFFPDWETTAPYVIVRTHP